MFSRPGRWIWTPSATPLQPKTWNAIFGLHSTSDDRPGWSMDSNPICHPSPVKKWNACFWITFNVQKHEMLIFGLHSTSDVQQAWSMDLNPICHPSASKNMKCSFLDYIQLPMIGQAGQWTQTPSATPLQWKNEMLVFGLPSTSDDWLGWSMDLNPIYHLSPAKKMKCSFLDYIQLLMISWIGQWTRTPSTTPLQPKTWNACFWITFNFWWSARLVDALKPHLPPLSSQKNEMLIFGLHSKADDRPGWSMDLNPIYHLSPAKKMKCSFLDYVQLLTIAGLVDGLKPHLSPLSSQKNEMLVFGLPSTSDDWPGWSMDSNPICHPSPAIKNEMLIFGLHSTSDVQQAWSMDLNPICHPSAAKNMKCSFLDYIQLLMFSRPGRWIWTPSATPLHPKTWNAHFWITFNFWWLARLVNGLKPHLPPLSSEKMKCLFLDYLQLLMIGWAGRAKKKNEMLIFGLRSTSDDWPGWSIDLSPVCHLSADKKMKCSFLDYIQLLMIGQAGPWTRTPSATPLQPKKWNAHFWITFNFWWSGGLVDRLEPHLPPLSSQKKWNAHFWITFNFWWSGGLVDGHEPHLPPLSSHKNEMLIFGLHSTPDDWLGWSMDMSPVCHLSAAKKLKCSFLGYVQLLMIGWAGWWTQT